MWIDREHLLGVLVTQGANPLEIVIQEFTMRINDTNVTFPKTTVTLPINENSYIGIDLTNDYNYHFLKRNFQDGMIWVGNVKTNATWVETIEQITPELPCDIIVGFKEKLVSGIKGVKIAILFDSLGTSAGGVLTWDDMLFNSSLSNIGFNVPSVIQTNSNNYSSGGQTSHYGLCGLERQHVQAQACT